jgi:hypothetical protein
LNVIQGEQTEGVIMTVAKKKTVEDLIGHAMSDKSFRDRLLASPEETLRAEGYEVGPEVIEAIKAANADDVNKLAGAFESDSAQRKAAF